jgi:murein DD-endopeptidase MepM/ murein hydrolase activator NlpD
VPEGTLVGAAEDGVVDYSGNELKSYGNLVLVRHSNGYVTAYAHASEVLVKRGDAIRRGQIIAKSGSRAKSDRRSCISRSAKAFRRLTRSYS